MNINYLKILEKVSVAKDDIEKLWKDTTENKTFEDKKADYIVEKLIESLDSVSYELKRLSWPTVEGKLQEDPEREKFELIRSDNGRGIGWQFSCGDYLEVYDDDTEEWYPGRVEHTTRNGSTGYYFHCNVLGHPFLYTGMKARIRKEFQ